MRVLLDTHLLLWSAYHVEKLPAAAKDILLLSSTTPYFSIASLWEVGIKFSYRRADFVYQPREFRRALFDMGFEELTIAGEHVFATDDLPQLHRDPFDRMLVAQSMVEGMELLTSDAMVARYPGPIRYCA